jgi:alcohol dehydrogenase, propanol-preferring
LLGKIHPFFMPVADGVKFPLYWEVMRSQILPFPGPLSALSLRADIRARPTPAHGQILVRVRTCAVCRTDLHIMEGDLPAKQLPIIPGHQVVGTVAETGPGVAGLQPDDRIGVPWLHRACGVCAACRRGEENLCPQASFTGWDVDGGFAEYLLAEADFVHRIPARFSDAEAAPLLCGGVIGYRSLRIAEVQPREQVGLVGFGASARLALQVLRYWNCEVSVFTRSAAHRDQALALGAAWVGTVQESPIAPLDRAVIFAPAGELVPRTLRLLRPGGTLAINAIHMSNIPALPYAALYGERTIRSVTNATRQDAIEFLALADRIPIRVQAQTYPLTEANQALLDLKEGALLGAAVLEIDSATS